ncbi:MAG: AAA family ATPase [Clostridia bacterium]|nr:AAA family ATPase [Clostridia bacterium]
MERIEEIIGYKKEVEKLKSICDFLKNTDKYVKFGVELPKALLIYGEEGVGKTLMAEALTIDCEREIFYVFTRTISVKKIKKIFKSARKSAHSVVLIDDIGDKNSAIYGQLIREMNGCRNGEVFVIATVEDKKDIPEYFFDEFDSNMIIELQPPKIQEACEIFKPIFDEKKIEKDFNINDFCCFAQTLTYSDVEEIFNDASRLAVYEGRERVAMRHLITAGLLYKEDELAKEFDLVSAYHEVGHATVDLLLGGEAAFIALFEDYGGVFYEKDCVTKTYHDKERRYIVGVAGKACEEIFTGTSSIGSYSDLARASTLIEDDVKILASQGFEYFDSTELNSPAYNDTLAKKVQSEIQKYFDKAKELIVENRPLVEALVKQLENNFYLVHSEIYKIYNDYVNNKK